MEGRDKRKVPRETRIDEDMTKRKVMVVGAEGLLGQQLIQTIRDETNWKIIAVGRKFVVDEEGYRRWEGKGAKEWKELMVQERWRPHTIINAAAMTNVDACEINKEEAWNANVVLVENLIGVCRRIEATMVQISTDHVFDGEAGPYSEEDRPNPINYYGRTKLAAENICIRSGVESVVIRTMWLYGARNGKRQSFLDWVLERITRDEEIPITDDELGNPTHYEDLAYGIIRCVEQKGHGTIHMAGPERVTRKEWVDIICQQLRKEKECRLNTIKSSDLARAAKRPLSSGLVSMRARYELGISMADVREGVEMTIVRDERNEG